MEIELELSLKSENIISYDDVCMYPAAGVPQNNSVFRLGAFYPLCAEGRFGGTIFRLKGRGGKAHIVIGRGGREGVSWR